MMRLREAFWPWADIWIRSGWRVQLHCATGRARLLDPSGMVIAAGTPDECTTQAKRLPPSAGARRAAILLHGLWNYPGIMHPLAQAQETQGWAVANLGYPSLRLPLAAHGAAASLAAQALADDGAVEIAFVGHSLGGLVARTAMASAATSGWNAGPLVLIGSPAYGSVIAGRAKNIPGYETLVGACAPAVTPEGAAAVPLPIAKEVLVIAGGTGGRGFNPLLRGDNDGLIAVAETRMPEHETGVRLVRSIHKTLPVKPATISACINFLTRGA
jgi:pimeloyl-ACP methyl ester carboxylesterase